MRALKPSFPVQELKEQLSQHYDFSGEVALERLKYSENLTYLVKDGERKRVLRINKPGYHSMEELRDEIRWIRRLKQDTDLHIADAVDGSDGEPVQTIVLNIEDGAERFHCSVFEYMEGKTLDHITGASLYRYAREIGRACAVLNGHSIRWEDSGKLSRPTWNFEDLIGENGRWGDYRAMPGLTEGERQVMDEALRVIARRLDRYGKGKDRYGLIHADMNPCNFIVRDRAVQLIDFDDCGYGWFLWDLGNVTMRYSEGLRQLADAWLEGYTSIRWLSGEDLAEADTFILLRKIVRVAWIASHWGNDTVAGISPAYPEEVASLARRYLEKFT